jgi:uncharacterized damage-inducible protein DinB
VNYLLEIQMKIHSTVILALAGALFASAANPTIAETKVGYTAIKTNIIKAAEKMPEDAYSFRPTPEERTFGELVGHIADAQIRICGAATGETKPATAAKLTAKAALVEALKASFDFCDAAIDSVNDENAMTMMAFQRAQRTKLGVLIYNVGHNNESYGTMAVYLRLKGVVPPSSEK